MACKQSNLAMAGIGGRLSSVVSRGGSKREDIPLLSSKMPELLRTREENIVKEK